MQEFYEDLDYFLRFRKEMGLLMAYPFQKKGLIDSLPISKERPYSLN